MYFCSMVSEFGYLLLFLIGAIFLVLLVLGIARLMRPNKPNLEKNTTYESGEEAQGVAQLAFNNRFYIVAIIFLLFDLELVLLFPWVTIFGDADLIQSTNGLWAVFSGIEMLIFVGILAVGLAYVWKKGYLDWVVPQKKEQDFKSPVPKELYSKINEKYS